MNLTTEKLLESVRDSDKHANSLSLAKAFFSSIHSPFPCGGDFFLLIYSLDPDDQGRQKSQNISPDLDPNCLTL